MDGNENFGGHRSRPKKRRSWFDGQSANQPVYYEIAVEKGKENVPVHDVEDIQFLILDHFTSQPKLDFGNVKVGQTKCCYLHVRNPRDYEQTLSVEKFPIDKGFSVERMEVDIEAGDTLILPIRWTPPEPGNYRQMVRFRVDDTYRLMAYFLGHCPQPQQPKKKSGAIKSLRKPVMSKPKVTSSKPQEKALKPDATFKAQLQNRSNIMKAARPQRQSRSRQAEKKTVPRSASCNDRIIGDGISQTADSRMTVRLSKPKVLTQENLKYYGSADNKSGNRTRSPVVTSPHEIHEERVVVENTVTEIIEHHEIIREQMDIYTTEVVESNIVESLGNRDNGFTRSRCVSRDEEVIVTRETVVREDALARENVFSPHVKTLQEDDDRFPITPTRRMTFKKSEPEMPRTPVYISPRVKALQPDGDRFTPSRRVNFKKDDPNLPSTPVRRDTFHLHEPRTPHTPIIKSPSPRRRFRAHSVSPERSRTPTVTFNDDTRAHLNVPQDTLSHKKRMGTYTKLNISRDSLESGESQGHAYGTWKNPDKTENNREIAEEEEDTESVISSIYRTAQTSPCQSDTETEPHFEDSISQFNHDDTVESNATVLENSALMSSLLHQKLQKVASFLEESGIIDEESRDEKLSPEVLQKCAEVFEDKNRMLLSQSSGEEYEHNNDESENFAQSPANDLVSIQDNKKNTSAKSCDDANFIDSLANTNASDESSVSEDMSLREFSERMKEVLPETSFTPNDSSIRPSVNDSAGVKNDASNYSFKNIPVIVTSDCSLNQKNVSGNSKLDIGNSSDSITSLIASPVPLPPVPVFRSSKLSSAQKVQPESEQTNDSISELLDFSFKPLPPVPVFEKSHPSPQKSRKSVMFRNDVKETPAALRESKYRPSEVPQNPFDITRSSMIGIHNPGFEDSIFADPPEEALKADIGLKSSLRKGKGFADSLRPPERPSQIPPAPFDDTASSVIEVVNPGVEDSIFAEQSYGQSLKYGMQFSQADFTGDSLLNKLAKDTTFDKDQPPDKQVKNLTFEKESANSKPLRNATFDKENEVASDAYSNSLRASQRPRKNTYDKEIPNDSLLNLTPVKPLPVPKFEPARKNWGKDSMKTELRIGESSFKANADISTDDKPLTLDDLALSPQPQRDQGGDRVTVEIRQRLSSTPASVISAADSLGSKHVTTPNHVTRTPFTPSPIGGSTFPFPLTASMLVKSGNLSDEIFRPGSAENSSRSPLCNPRRVSTFPVVKKPLQSSIKEDSPLSMEARSGETLYAIPEKAFSAPQKAETWSDKSDAIQSPGERCANATVTKSRPSVTRLPTVGEPKRSLFGKLKPADNKEQDAKKCETAGSQQPQIEQHSSGPAERQKAVALDFSPPVKQTARRSTPSDTFKKISPQKRDLSAEGPTANRKRFRADQTTKAVAGKTSGPSLRLSKTTLLRKQAAQGNLKTNSKPSQSSKATGPKPRSNSSGSVTNPASTTSSTTNSRTSAGSTNTSVKRPVKGVAQKKLKLLKPATKTALPTHPLAFAAKNIYYDERWMEKQDRGFTKWLNFVLTPADFHVHAKNTLKIDAGRLKALDQQDISVAPTKEAISLRAYSVTRRLNRLRRDACALFTSDAFVAMTNKLEREINCGRMSIRKDRNVFADLGLKQKVLNMLLCYNPLWLRIALEVVYGEVIIMDGAADALRLSHFILHRLLSHPDISAQYAHPTVPHSYSTGYYEALGQFALKKFLLVVMFLDLSKLSRLIQEDPCLFCVDSEYKESKDILLSFSRDFLAGEGDLVKHLSLLGYRVTHKQSALEEVDYGVTNLAVDLRDGLRITRVVSLLSGDWSMTSQLRCPAISRLQKVHNVQVAMNALLARGATLEAAKGGKIDSRDIVDGHREKTLQLLWMLIFHFKVEQVIDEKRLKEEIVFLKKELKLKRRMAALDQYLDPDSLGVGIDRRESVHASDLYASNEKIQLLLRWCKLICAFYDVKVDNFTVSWSDGRALCYLLHHYHPELIASDNIQQQTTQTQLDEQSLDKSSDDSFTFSFSQPSTSANLEGGAIEQLLENERRNFKLLYDVVGELGGVPMMVRCADMSATIPDEKVVITYVSYLCTRLLDLREEFRAARVIQAAWREYAITRKIGHLQVKQKAAAVIQRCVRAFLSRRRAWRHHAAALCIQSHYRGYRARQMKARLLREREMKQKTSAALIIQACIRGLLCRRLMACKEGAAVCIQKYYRGYAARKSFDAHKQAAVCIQKYYRGYMERKRFVARKSAAVCIQRYLRDYLSRRQSHKQVQAVMCLQKYYRGFAARKRFNIYVKAATCIQSYFRGFSARRQCKTQRQASVRIQRFFRGHLARKQFVAQRKAAVCIQTYFRSYMARKRFGAQKQALVCLQRHCRGYVVRKRFDAQRRAIVCIQKYYRSYAARKRFGAQRKAAVSIQRHYRGYAARKRFDAQKQATICIQKYYRGYIARKRFDAQKQAATCIQKFYRGFMARKRNDAERQAAVCIQKYYRGYSQRKRFDAQKQAAVNIQRHYRGCVARKRIGARKRAAMCIQKYYRGYIVRKRVDARKESAMCIQKYYRGFMARKLIEAQRKTAICIQKHYRSYIARKRFDRQRDATVCLQKYYRGFIVRKRIDTQKRAATGIQKLYRGYIVRKRIDAQKQAVMCIQKYFRGYMTRDRINTQRNAAACIQKYFRGYMARKRVHVQKQAAVCIQKFYRGFVARKRIDAQKQSAVIIQKHFRGCIARKRFDSQRRAATIIQKYYRGYMMRKRIDARKQATTCIQKYFRGFIVRKRIDAQIQAALCVQKYYRGYLTRNRIGAQRRAAICIQKYFRGYMVRKQYDAEKQATVYIQKWWRAARIVKLERRKFEKLQTATRVIQHHTRQWLQRRRAQRQSAALKIQTCWRKAVLRRRFILQIHAVVKIQAFYRTVKARRDFVQLKQAAITVQTHFRRAILRRQFVVTVRSIVKLQTWFRSMRERNKFVAKKQSAVTIQSHVRALITRRKWVKLKCAAVMVQSHFRCKKAREEFIKQKHAAILIQSNYRRWSARVRYLKLKTATICVQSRFRSVAARRNFLKQRHAAVKIQSWYRQWRKRRDYKTRQLAAITIQSWFRGVRERKTFNRQKRAIVTLQSNFRRFKAQTAFSRQKQAAVIIQRSYKCFGQKRRYLALKSAVVVIQSYYRRIRDRKEFSRQKSAAVTIQTSFRTFKQRKEFQKTKQACVIIQSYYRQLKQRRWFLEQKQAAIAIQSSYRSVTERKKFLKLKTAVVLIQSTYKGFKERQHYMRMKSSASSIQTCFRRWKARRKFCEFIKSAVAKRQAAITIQSYFRGQRDRRKVEELKLALHREAVRTRAAVTIQTAYKGYKVRKEYARTRECIVLLQRQIRRILYLRHYNRVSSATKTIQRWWRGIVATRTQRSDYLRTCNAVKTLQTHVKLYVYRQRFLRIKHAVRVIQRSWRKHRKRVQHENKLAAVVCIQRRFRKRKLARQERIRNVIQRRAVVTIQRYVRAYMTRRRRFDSAATCIQSLARGVLVRRRVARLKRAVVALQRTYRERRLQIRQQKEVTAAIKLQASVRGFLARRYFINYLYAVVKLQSLWRGRQTRKCVKDAKVTRVRQRIQTATENATTQPTLRERTISALNFLLEMKQVDPLIEALVELDTLTQLLPQCCERLVEVNAVGVLYKLIISCNRSEPHIRIITYALNTLLNVAMYEKTRPAVYLGERECVAVLVEMAFIYRNKKSPIFTRACTLLGIIAQHVQHKAEIVRMRTQVDKLHSIYNMVMRSGAKEDERLKLAARMAAVKNCTFTSSKPARIKLNMSPAWVLKKGKRRENFDHRQAITFVLQSLGMQ